MREYITWKHRLVENAGYVFMTAACVIARIFLKTIPEEIPVKFDFAGNPTAYGSRTYVFILLILMFFLMLGLSAILHFLPVDLWNIPFEVTEKNAELLYGDAAMLIAQCILEFGLYCLGYVFALYNGQGEMQYVAYAFAAVLVISIAACLIKMKKHSREK